MSSRIPTNDNMYDETIQRALRRLKIEPLVLPAQFLDAIVANFRSDSRIVSWRSGHSPMSICSP
jgi:hypothetical protein